MGMDIGRRFIYLDNHASTSPSEAVIEAIARTMRAGGNAHSTHAVGREARRVVEESRACVLGAMNVPPNAIRMPTLLYTSGATEANNLSIMGIIEGKLRERGPGVNVITTPLEHSSVLAPLERARARGWCTVTHVPVGPSGIVRPLDIDGAITPATVLVCIMGAQNEVGTIQPLADIARVCRARDVLLHADLSQSFGKVPHPAAYDLASVSAHKLHGPQGVGALYVGERALPYLVPQQVGGTQEEGLRAGTLNVPGIAGFGAACKEHAARWSSDQGPRVGGLTGEALREAWLRDALAKALRDALGDDVVHVNGATDPAVWEPQLTDDPTQRRRLPHNLNVSMRGVCPESLFRLLDGRVALSGAAACRGAGRSQVLAALGAPEDGAAIRFGLGPDHTETEVREVAQLVADACATLRGVGCPLHPHGGAPKPAT